MEKNVKHFTFLASLPACFNENEKTGILSLFQKHISYIENVGHGIDTKVSEDGTVLSDFNFRQPRFIFNGLDPNEVSSFFENIIIKHQVGKKQDIGYGAERIGPDILVVMVDCTNVSQPTILDAWLYQNSVFIHENEFPITDQELTASIVVNGIVARNAGVIGLAKQLLESAIAVGKREQQNENSGVDGDLSQTQTETTQ